MKKLKNLNIVVVAVLVVVLGISGFVMAGPTNVQPQPVNIENVTIENFTLNVNGGSDMGMSLGANGDSNFTNVVAEGYITAGDGFTASGDVLLNKPIATGDILNASSSLYVGLTLTAAQVCDNTLIHVNSLATTTAYLIPASVDITLPATSTLFADCLTENGASTFFFLENRSITAASTTQIVAGTGMDLVEPDGQNVEIGGGNYAKIEIVRTDKSITIQAMTSVDEFIAAD